MAFGTFVDVLGDFFHAVRFPKAYSQFQFEGIGVYLVKGKVTEEFGFPMLQIEQMGKIKIMNEEGSRGFLPEPQTKKPTAFIKT